MFGICLRYCYICLLFIGFCVRFFFRPLYSIFFFLLSLYGFYQFVNRTEQNVSTMELNEIPKKKRNTKPNLTRFTICLHFSLLSRPFSLRIFFTRFSTCPKLISTHIFRCRFFFLTNSEKKEQIFLSRFISASQ